ncbi:MAG: hypothetical protein KAS86_01925, partial [Candidatus Omnitrophica bacterium]|nr:hypothetical protein [Candidatus Omnitrophota bacterium]
MMSIITEALKKIQTGRYDQVVEGNREEQNGVPAAARAEQRSPGSRSLFFNVLLACAVAGIISAGMLFLWRNRQSVMEMPVFGKRAVISSGLEVGDVEHTATVPPGETVHD